MESHITGSRRPLHELFVALLIGLAVCAIRIGIFDFHHFILAGLPSHDSLSAAGMFESSVHSVRIDGDIAWWLPSSQGGYPQYYNMFLSPLAPTAGNITFLAWLTIIRILGWVHITVPEYFQFLTFELILMPTLAYAALGLLLRRFCTTWIAPMLGIVCYALSGAGLWNNAWMFYQEWTNLFLLIFALDLFCERPTVARSGILALAALNLVTSANYWTIFSQWYLFALLIAYVACRWDDVRNAGRWLGRDFPWSNWLARFAVAAFVCLIVTWVALLGIVHQEQASVLLRYGDAPSGYSIAQSYGRAQTGGIVRFTAALFDPELKAPASGYLAGNWMHAANYVGVGLLPLLAAFLFLPWLAFDVILVVLLVTSYLVTLAAGTFIFLWQVTPGMASQLHAFYFYSYFVEISLILIGARALDRIVRGGPETLAVRAAPLTTAVLGLACLAAVFAQYSPTDPNAYDRLAYIGIFLILASAILFKLITVPTRLKTVLAALLLFMVVGDLSRYYWIATGNDQMFTLWFRKVALEKGSLPASISQKLATAWPIPKTPDRLDAGISDNMPIATSLWPENTFNPSQAVRQFQALPDAKRAELTPDHWLDFVASDRTENAVPLAIPRRDPSLLSYRITDWGYNGMQIEIDAKTSGKLLLAQTFDAAWKFRLNGKAVTSENVNYWMTAFPVESGHSTLSMDFSPLSRKIYRPTLYLLVVTIFLILLLIRRDGRREVAAG